MQFSNRTSAALLSAAKLFQFPIFALNQSSSYSSSAMGRAPVIAVCHGGGPMPVMNDPGHAELIKSMTTKVPSVLGLGTSSAPRAIVLVTAHWTERRPTISNGKKHKLYYDYGGFPPETYRLKYDAPGSPEVAAEVYEALEKAGLQPEMDGERGKCTTISQILSSYIMRKPGWMLMRTNNRLGSRRLRSHATHQPQS